MIQPGLALQNALCLLGTNRFDCPVVIFKKKFAELCVETITLANIVE